MSVSLRHMPVLVWRSNSITATPKQLMKAAKICSFARQPAQLQSSERSLTWPAATLSFILVFSNIRVKPPHYCVYSSFSLYWNGLRSCASAGLFFILPCTDSFINVDMRTITFDIPPQEVCVTPPPARLLLLSNWNDVSLSPRFWPKTPWRWAWMEWCTTGSRTPRWP